MPDEVRRYGYQILCYAGEAEIICDVNTESDAAHAPLGMGYRSFTLMDRRPPGGAE